MNVIEVKNVTKTFVDRKFVTNALNNVSLNVRKGEIHGLLGPNGAGKTTLIYILSNLLLPDKGTTKILGMDVVKTEREIWRRINVCFGNTSFFSSFSPKKILRYYSYCYDIPRHKADKKIKYLSEILGFKDYIDREFMGLSKGMKQKIALAKALLNDPEVLLLDEPTIGLDVDIAGEVRKIFMNLAKEHGVTILLTSHYMQEVETLCKNITLLCKGKVLEEGDISKIKKRIKTPDTIHIVLDNYKNIDFVKKLPGVSHYTIEDGRLKLYTRSGKESIEPLLKRLRKKRRKVKDIEVRNASLEEVFIKLVRDKNA